MAGNDLSRAINQYRVGKTERADALGYLPQLFGRMGSGITRGWSQLIDAAEAWFWQADLWCQMRNRHSE